MSNHLLLHIRARERTRNACAIFVYATHSFELPRTPSHSTSSLMTDLIRFVVEYPLRWLEAEDLTPKRGEIESVLKTSMWV